MPHQCTACGRTFQDGSKEMLSGCPDCGGNKFQFMPAGAVEEAAGGTGGATPKKAPEGTASASSATDRTPAETKGDEGSSAVGRAAATVREWVSTRDDESRGSSASSAEVTDATGSTGNDSHSTGTDPRSTGTDSRSTRNERGSADDSSSDLVPDSEDSAQASARRDVVSKAELPDEPPQNVQVSNSSVSDSPISDSSERPDDSNVVDAPEDENPGLKELREELNSQFESIRIVNPGQYELNLMELYEREEYIISLQEDGKYVIEVPDAWEQTER